MSSVSVIPLFSGSKGNCTLVVVGGTKILIDAGAGRLKTSRKLKSFGFDLSDIDALLITHCHSDHIKYLEDVAFSSDCKVYCSKKIERIILSRLFDNEEKLVAFDGAFSIGSVHITPFELPHDATCFGYKIESGESSFTYMTDLGFFDEELLPIISGTEKIMIESNHDEEMLEKGSYPYYLKKRILSVGGHLSNGSCANVCQKLYDCGTKEFILGHLSEENNCPELAYNAVNEALKSQGSDYKLFVTTRNGLDEIV